MHRDFLKELGLEKDIIDKIMAENGNDINATKQKLEGERDNYKSQLDEANKAMQSYKDMDIDGIKKSVEDYKQKFEQSEADRKAFEHKTKITGYVKSLGLKDDVYENHIANMLIEKGLQFDGDKLIGGDDIVNGFKESHADAFKSDTSQSITTGVTIKNNNSDVSGVEAAFLARNPDIQL